MSTDEVFGSAEAMDKEKEVKAIAYLDHLKAQERIDSLQFKKLIRLLGDTQKTELLQSLSPDILLLIPRLSRKTQAEFSRILGTMSYYPTFLEVGKEFFKQMLDSGIEADVFAYTSLINICARANDIDGALKIWEVVKQSNLQPDAHMFTALLTACAKRHDEAKAHAILSEMERYKVKPNVYVYSALLSVYANTHNTKRAFEILKKMADENVKPNEWTFTTLMRACINSEDIRLALDILPLMDECGVKPNAHTFTMLISACASQPTYHHQVRGLFERAKQTNSVSVGLVTAMLEACRWLNDDKVTSEVLSLMEESKIAPNERTCTVLLLLYSKMGQLDKAYNILNTMPSHGVRPNSRHLNTLLAAYTKHREIDKDKIISVMNLMYRFNIKPDLCTYDSLVHLNARIKGFEAALAVLDQVRADGFTPDGVIYKSLMEICAEAKPAHMLGLFEQMRKDGIEPDARVFNLLTRVIVKLTQRLVQEDDYEYWERLAVWGAWPNQTCVSILRALATPTEISRTGDFLRHLIERSGMQRPAAVYTTLLWLCLRHEDGASVQIVIQEMLYARPVDIPQAMESFISACYDQPQIALEMVEQVEKRCPTRAAVQDLAVLFRDAVAAGHLPTAARTFALLEERGASPEDLSRWRQELSSVEAEVRLREELASQRTRLSSRKYALFKDSIRNTSPSASRGAG